MTIAFVLAMLWLALEFWRAPILDEPDRMDATFGPVRQPPRGPHGRAAAGERVPDAARL